VLLLAADEAWRSLMANVARDFAEAAERRSRRVATRVDALRWQAVMEAATARDDSADQLLALARRQLPELEGVARERLAAEVDLAAASVAARRPTVPAIDAATRALAYFSSATPPAEDRLPEVLLARARVEAALGRDRDARADLSAAIAVIARMRHYVAAGVDQATLSDTSRSLVEELIRVAAARDEAAVFAETERLRGWDLPARAPQTPATLEGLRRTLPSSVLVVDYSIGAHASYAWLIRRGRSALVRIDADETTLAALVGAPQSGRSDELRRRLGDLLLTPVRSFVRPGDLIAIVPDGPLHLLSFASLPGFAHRYLVEEHALLAVPNVATLLVGAGSLSRPARRALAVGNPALDRARWPDLPDLPGARAEIATTRAAYDSVQTLAGAAATRDAVVDGLRAADAAHFATHGVVNEFTPSDSLLVLAGPDALTAGEIRRLPLSRLRLVVLAACDSGRGFLTRSDGPMGLARAFLAAGAGAVVSSLTEVSDAASEDFFRTFYQHARGGGDVAEALRAAQLQALSSSRPGAAAPSLWANFVVTGSLASGASSHAFKE
jgi:hypothetical protein